MVAMNANDLLAAAVHGQRIPFGMILLALVVLGALGFGTVRLTQRARLNRAARPVTKPGPPRKSGFRCDQLSSSFLEIRGLGRH